MEILNNMSIEEWGKKKEIVIDIEELKNEEMDMPIDPTDIGNNINYIHCMKKKNGEPDLEKAKRFLKHLVNRVNKGEQENEYIK